RIFEGTNEIHRLIIPATLVKRIGRGRLPYQDFLQQVEREIADPKAWPPPPTGPIAREMRAADVAKRVVAYTARVLIERELASLKDRQQHLEIPSNMIIDLYAMDSVVGRTQRLLGHGSQQDDELRIAMTNVFTASANERVIDGARRLLERRGNELHHGDAALYAEQLDLAMESLRDPGGELDQDVIVFGHRGHPPSAPARAGCYLTYLAT